MFHTYRCISHTCNTHVYLYIDNTPTPPDMYYRCGTFGHVHFQYIDILGGEWYQMLGRKGYGYLQVEITYSYTLLFMA